MINKPSLIVDKEKCIRNIRKMKAKADKANVLFRPHFKTHQSASIGEWFREEGVEAITVSSISMAKYFADNGWKDISVAFPLNILEMEEINALAERITLNLLVESVGSVRFLKHYLSSNINLYIKIDTGYHRTGIWCENIEEIQNVVDEIKGTEKTEFIGFLTHSGQNYHAKDEEEIRNNHGEVLRIMSELKDYFKKDNPNIISSIGDTPSCSIVEEYYGIDELRPGNFVFYDLDGFIQGRCDDDELAVAMACPVVAKHDERKEIIIYGGGVHFSKEYIDTGDGNKLYGSIVKFDGDEWTPIIAGGYLASLSQEHGVLKVSEELFKEIEIGELLGIVPVHSCMAVSCISDMFTTKGEKLDLFK